MSRAVFDRLTGRRLHVVRIDLIGARLAHDLCGRSCPRAQHLDCHDNQDEREDSAQRACVQQSGDVTADDARRGRGHEQT